MYQYYNIASLIVKMDVFGRTEEQSRPYLIDNCHKADIIVENNIQHLKAKYPLASDDALQYIASARVFYNSLLDYSGLMLHASALAMDGKAYLFSADSGVGKSSHTALWKQAFGEDRVCIINDDKPALRLLDGTWYACGTPWSGKTDLNTNICCPLGGICFLDRGQLNKIEAYSDSDLIFRFLKQTYRSKNLQRSDKLLSLINSLLNSVPVWHLECNLEEEAAHIAMEAMTGKSSDSSGKEF